MLVFISTCLVVMFSQTSNVQGNHPNNNTIPNTFTQGNRTPTIGQISASLIVSGANVYDKNIVPRQPITFSGTLNYQGITTPPRAGFGALSFNVDNHVKVLDSPSLNIDVDRISIEFWIKLHELRDVELICKEQTYRVRYRGGHLQFLINANGSWSSILTESHSPLEANVWAHIVVVYDGSRIKLYKNGVQDPTTTSVTGNLVPNDRNLFIMAFGLTDALSNYANGIIDEIRIYNRSLSVEEITEHYEGIYTDETGLVLHLNFDGNIKDSSGHRNSLILSGATWTDGFVNINVKVELGGVLRKTISLVNSSTGDFIIPDVIGESNIGIYNYTIYAIDVLGKFSVQNQTVSVLVVDKLNIVLKGTTDERVDVDSSTCVYFNVTRSNKTLFDGTDGSVFINDSLATWDELNKYWKIYVTQSSVTSKNYVVTNITHPEFGILPFEDNVGAQQIIWDRINITLTVQDDRIDVGSILDYSWIGFHEYDRSLFEGAINLNDTLSKDDIGKFCFTTTNIIDPVYNLTKFTSNSVYCIWDIIRIVQGGVAKSSNVIGDAVSLWFEAIYEYDGLTFQPRARELETLYVNGIAMEWSTINDRWEHGFTLNTLGEKEYTISGVLDTYNGLTVVNSLGMDLIITSRNKPIHFLFLRLFLIFITSILLVRIFSITYKSESKL